MSRLRVVWVTFAMAVLVATGYGQAAAQTAVSDASVNAWLMRTHEASRHSAYAGTFVVSTGSDTSSAKIWHVCEGTQQMERVDALSGRPRSTFRRNNQVVTFFPDAKVAVSEMRDALGAYPNLLKSREAGIDDFYQLKVQGHERIAGFDAEVVQLVPKDNLRYGYRVWSEKKTGLVLQLQTLDLDGRVMEQVAFSELQLDAPVSMDKLSQMMADTEGYRVVRPEVQAVSASVQGWVMRKTVPGFKATGCYKRPAAGASEAPGRADGTMQWIFSDGLATVSLFAELFDHRRHASEGAADGGGATHILTRRINQWWVTGVGEVPLSTLAFFVQGLERKK